MTRARRTFRGPHVGAVLLALLLLLSPLPAEASGIGSTGLTVDFTQPDEARDLARWSLPDRIRCSTQGLGWEGRRDTSYDAEVHVTKALPVGHSWWAATNAGLRVTLTWSDWEERHVPGNLYVRHSPDARHWSEWRQLARPRPGRSPEHVYQLEMNTPRPKVETWAYIMRPRYAATNPPERERTDEGLAAWVEAAHPGYLAREKPFFGYLQFLLTCDMRGGCHLQRMEILVRYVTPGPYGPPSVPGVDPRELHQERWGFRAGALALPEASRRRTRATRRVLSAALRQLVTSSLGGPDADQEVDRVVLFERTALRPEACDLDLAGAPAYEPSLAGLRGDTQRDFVRRNSESRLVPPGLDAGVAVEGMQRHGLDYLLRGGRPGREEPPHSVWSHVHNSRNQGTIGLVWVSEPGFSQDGTQALVHVSCMQRHETGAGRYYLLDKDESGWAVTATQTTWTR
jgi:hypothetical protein